MKLLTSTLVLAAFTTSGLGANDLPFIGKWKLDKQQSRVTGQQSKVQDLGNNKLKFTMANGDSDTITMNGTDQPVHYGYTMALTSQSPTSFKMDVKKNGKLLSSMTHSLSGDETTQTVKGTEYRPDGSTSDFEEVSKRIGAGSGWTGTWESTKVDSNSPEELDIAANGDNGVALKNEAYKATLRLKFDGKSYEIQGPTVPPGMTTTGKRTGARSFELTYTLKGKVLNQQTFKVSPDGKTLSIVEHDPGQPNVQTSLYNKM